MKLECVETSHGPGPLADLTEKSQRERLSPAAVRGFFNIVDRWSIRDEDARVLLGGVSNGPYYVWKKEFDRTASADVLTRISYLAGIFAALHNLYGKTLADKWVSLPNTNRIFRGDTPLAYMKRGGIPAMQVVRRLLDARSGGA
jgi:Protein of unknown function (DUF2384)